MTEWTHNGLAHDLALLKANGNRVVFEDIPMGPAGSERPDVYCIAKSFARPRPTTYEVKVSRSDFLQDVKKGKWQCYKAYSERIFFACPDGLISPKEVPQECGLIVRKDKAWRILKPAPRTRVRNVSLAVLVKLMIATHSGERCTDRGYRKHLEQRHLAINHIGNELGEDVRDFCQKNFTARYEMKHRTHDADKIIDAAHEAFGIPRWQGVSAVIEEIKKLNHHN